MQYNAGREENFNVQSISSGSYCPHQRGASPGHSYESGKQSVVRGDPDKIVCQKEEKIGSRLGAKKVCLTVREWTARHSEDRDSTERIQSGAKVCSLPPCEFGKEF